MAEAQGPNKVRLAVLIGWMAGLMLISGFCQAGTGAGGGAGGLPCGYDVTIIQGPVHPVFGPAIVSASGLNDLGHVCGSWSVLGGDGRPFIWTPEAGMMTLPMPPNAFRGWANNINDAGVIACTLDILDIGFRAYIYDHGTWTELPPLPGGLYSEALAINNAGVVVGYRSIGPGINPYNAFIWSPGAGFTDLGVMQGLFSIATDVSDSGFVIGWTGSLVSPTAFVYDGKQLTFLDPIPKGISSLAGSVNDFGVLAGSGELPIGTSETVFRAFSLLGEEWTIVDPLPGYDNCGFVANNDAGFAVGSSWLESDANDRRAVVWAGDALHDLNEMHDARGFFFAKRAVEVNEAGQILVRGQSPYSIAILSQTATVVGDLDCSGTVNGIDLGILLANWSIPPGAAGCSGQPLCVADVDGNGVVDGIDLGILLAHWTF